MWYVFPQLAGLGYSDMARFYAIKDIREASDYLAHPMLGNPDDVKLRSSMTLFSLVPDTDPVFQAVLNKFFGGIPDSKTLSLLNGTD